MSRPSNAAATTPFPVIDAGATRLSPPSNLNKHEQEVFKQIVASVPARHFAQSDLVLLTRYVKNISLAANAADHLQREGAVDANGKLSPWLRAAEKLDRTIIALASKLRLCPSARYDARAAQRNAREPPPSYYDLMREQREQLNDVDY
jgi:phage terminase small subunit